MISLYLLRDEKLIPQYNFTCPIPICYLYQVTTLSTREEFWYGHVVKKPTDIVMEYLKDIGLKLPFGISLTALGRYTILNILCDLSKEPIASWIIDGVNDE